MIRSKLQLDAMNPSWLLLPPKLEPDWEGFLLTLECGRNDVTALALSPDSTLAATSDDSGMILIWESNSGRPLQTLYRNHLSRSLAFSHDASRIAVGGEEGQIEIWDIGMGQHLQTFESYLLSDIIDNRLINVLYSHDSKRLAAVSRAGTLNIIDAISGQGWAIPEKKEFARGYYFSLSFSRDSARIVSAIDSDVATIWDTRTGQALQTFAGHDELIVSVAFSHDSNNIVSAGNNKIILWDSQTGAKLWTWQSNPMVFTAVFSKDAGQIVAVTSSKIKIWDAATKKLLHVVSCEKHFTRLGISLHCEKLIFPGALIGLAQVQNVSQNHYRRPDRGHKDIVMAVKFSKDSKMLVSGSGDNTLKIWDPMTGRCLHTLVGHHGSIQTVSWSYDSKLIASGSYDGTIRIWDAITGQCLHVLVGHQREIGLVKFAHGSEKMVSVCTEPDFRVWDSTNGECTHILNPPSGWKKSSSGFRVSASFSDDSTRVAVCFQENAVIWDVDTGECKIVIDNGEADSLLYVPSIGFSPDGQVIAISGLKTWKISLYDTKTGVFMGKIRLSSQNSLSFDRFSSNLCTTSGKFQMQSLPEVTSVGQAGSWASVKCRRRGIGIDGSWILRGSKRLLWLPPEFRSEGGRGRTDVSVSTVAIGCPSGRVLIMRFSDDDEDEDGDTDHDGVNYEDTDYEGAGYEDEEDEQSEYEGDNDEGVVEGSTSGSFP